MTFEDLCSIGETKNHSTLGETLTYILNDWKEVNSDPFKFLMDMFDIRYTYEFDNEMLGFHISADMTWEEFNEIMEERNEY